MAKIDKTYHKLLNTILEKGFKYEDPNRKGVYRLQIPSYTIEHDFKDGFPAITTKKLYWKGIVGELLTFLSGSTQLKDLHRNEVRFWDKDAFNYYKRRNPNGSIEDFRNGISERNHIAGDLGKIYPYQMRRFGENHIDQIKDLINTLINNPLATKKTVTMWNPSDANKQSLTPCHWSFEILVEPISPLEILNKSDKSKVPYKYNGPKYQFTLKWHQHSVDTFLGLPFNIAYYSLLAYIIGKLTNMKPKGIIGDLSNVHIYEPHLDAVKEQLSRDVDKYPKPLELENFDGFKLDMGKDIDQWLNSKKISDFKINGYESYPTIKAEMLAYS